MKRTGGLSLWSVLRGLVVGLAVSIAPARSAVLCAQEAAVFRVLFVPPPASVLRFDSGPAAAPDTMAESIVRGVTLGAEEAARTGALFGRTMELVSADAEAGVELLRAGRVSAVVALLDGWPAHHLEEVAARHGVPFVEPGPLVGAAPTRCRRTLFHVGASGAMRQGAIAAAGGAGAGARMELWHPSLERFGAAQLNDRYRARFGSGMDGAAWAGWMAVKILWESSLRAGSTDPATLVEYLRSESTEFDGHKGWALSFRRSDGHLRQPLYLVSGEGPGARVVAELPTRPAETVRSSRELLDALAPAPAGTECAGAGAP